MEQSLPYNPYAALIQRLSELAKQGHYGCEDRWYSCPKHEDGCTDPNAGTECNCGADSNNAEVESIMASLDTFLKTPLAR